MSEGYDVYLLESSFLYESTLTDNTSIEIVKQH